MTLKSVSLVVLGVLTVVFLMPSAQFFGMMFIVKLAGMLGLI